MAAVTGIVRKEILGSHGRGSIGVFDFVYPANASTATLPVGELGAYDMVVFTAQAGVSNYTVPFAEVAARTTGKAGVVTLGPQNGENSTDATIAVRAYVLRSVL